MDFISILDIVFLVTIFGSVIWIFSLVSGYGGFVGKALSMIGWGTALMGISHIAEVASLYLPNHHDADLVVLIHHLVASISFILIALGFKLFIKK